MKINYHWRFDLIEQKLAMEVKCTLTTRQTRCLSQVERLPLKHNEQDQPTWTKFTKNDGEIQVGKKA
jgi:hypothetical protein